MQKPKKRVTTNRAASRPKSPLKKLDKPLKKLDKKVIEKRPTRRYRASAFHAYVLLASVGFIVLALAARTSPYFAIDLRVTKAIQSYHGPMIDYLMFGISWLGFAPQSLFVGLTPAVVLFFLGLRWEAIVSVIAASSVVASGLVKFAVERPRPSVDLVRVFRELTTGSFPSGHVLSTTALCGYLAFLAFTLLKPSGGRTALLIFFASLAALMGPSRIYQGQHWFSDVMGAYLLGSLWLALTIGIYRWGKPRFFVHQPVAPENATPQPS